MTEQERSLKETTESFDRVLAMFDDENLELLGSQVQRPRRSPDVIEIILCVIIVTLGAIAYALIISS